MKLTLALLSLFAIVVIGCSKDKYTTVPQYEFKSISPSTVFNSNVVTFEGKFTDDEGDIDSAYIVYKWYNGATVVRNDTFRYSFDAMNVPKGTRKGELTADFEYNTTNFPGYGPLPAAFPRDTTATLGIILLDKAKQRSTYVESTPIRLKTP